MVLGAVAAVLMGAGPTAGRPLRMSARVVRGNGPGRYTAAIMIRTYNVRDIVITLLGSAGEWTTGENMFLMEFDSATQKRLFGKWSVTVAWNGPVSRGVATFSVPVRPRRP